ncbi:Integrator complex subunit 11 [Armadillidium vulgare]|nr:Integrator complex subunit 11 [Armadillidium vulgare]
MTPDRHLGAAWIDKCRPDLLISESTYATTIRDSKRCRERDFLKKVHDCVDRGGKVLIPVFALGRVQELCILLDTYWDRMNLKVPVYFTMGLAETVLNIREGFCLWLKPERNVSIEVKIFFLVIMANKYYRMFITWTNQKIRRTFVHRNMFDFNHIKPFDKSCIDNPGPMVVFATPGMLHAGLSLTIFKKWAPSEKNMVICHLSINSISMHDNKLAFLEFSSSEHYLILWYCSIEIVIMPGYCVQGTVGYKILNGAKKIDFEDKKVIDVNLSVELSIKF